MFWCIAKWKVERSSALGGLKPVIFFSEAYEVP